MSAWDELQRPPPRTAVAGGVEVGHGSRVRLHPKAGGDVFDRALEGRAAIVESVQADVDGTLQLAVVVEDDPGFDLGHARQPGHRFFFGLDEVEPLDAAAPPARVLVAGIGNTFLGDDGWGVELARRLLDRPLPAGVEVEDYGIRGMALAFALQDYDAALLLDAVPRGGEPGTLYVIEPGEAARADGLDPHGMDPVKVLRLAGEIGRVPDRLLVLGCEPLRVPDPDAEPLVGELSAPVAAALDTALGVVDDLLADLTTKGSERC